MGLHRFLGCFRMSREISSQRQFVERRGRGRPRKMARLPDPQGVGFGRRLFCPQCRADSKPENPSLRGGLLLSWPIEVSQQSELKGPRMTKQFDVAKIARLNEIKEEILDLLHEAVSLVRGTCEEQRANHWYATVCTALDKDNTQGDDSTITMQETIDALGGDSDA